MRRLRFVYDKIIQIFYMDMEFSMKAEPFDWLFFLLFFFENQTLILCSIGTWQIFQNVLPVKAFGTRFDVFKYFPQGLYDLHSFL